MVYLGGDKFNNITFANALLLQNLVFRSSFHLNEPSPWKLRHNTRYQSVGLRREGPSRVILKMLVFLIWQAFALTVYACKESGWAGDWIWLTIRLPPRDVVIFSSSSSREHFRFIRKFESK